MRLARIDVEAGKKRALEGKWRIWFLDEGGVVLTALVGRTWAPRGARPVLKRRFGYWTKINLVIAICLDGSLHFRTKCSRSFNHRDLAKFLEHLLRHEEGQIVLFWPGPNNHKGPEIRRVLRENSRLRVEWLPSYGFEYNPDEGVWDHLKWAPLRNHMPHDTEDNLAAVRRAMELIRRRKGMIASFFRHSKLARNDVEDLLKLSGGR